MARKLYQTYAYVNIVLSAMGIVINVVCIHALLKLKKLNRASFRFFLCLSISDCSFCILEIALESLTWHRTVPRLLFYSLWAMLSFYWILSPLIMLLIACDRLIHMKYLLQYPAIMTKKRSYVMIVIAIIIALQSCVSFILPFQFRLSSKHRSAIKIYQIVLMSVLLVMGIIFGIVYAWTYILVKNRVAELTSLHSTNGQRSVSNPINSDQDRAADPALRTARARDDYVTRAMVYVMICFAIFCFPDFILNAVDFFHIQMDQKGGLSVMTDAMLVYTRPAYIFNCSMNAILLMYFCTDIRRYVVNAVYCMTTNNQA